MMFLFNYLFIVVDVSLKLNLEIVYDIIFLRNVLIFIYVYYINKIVKSLFY